MAIFSGNNTRKFWKKIRKIKPKKDKLWDLFYLFGCKCQKLETRVEKLEERIDKLEKSAVRADPIIEDGHGSAWSQRCPVCHELSMQIMRPGSVQCGNPDCSQWRDDEEETS